MKLNNFTLFTLLWLGAMNMAVATQMDDDLFLYSLPELKQDKALVAPLAVSDAEFASQQPEQTLELDYHAPCDIKCGVSTTGLVLLQMVVEGKAEQQRRYTLMNPNYEP